MIKGVSWLQIAAACAVATVLVFAGLVLRNQNQDVSIGKQHEKSERGGAFRMTQNELPVDAENRGDIDSERHELNKSKNELLPLLPEIVKKTYDQNTASAALDLAQEARHRGLVELSVYLEGQISGNCSSRDIGANDVVHEKARWASEVLDEYCWSYDKEQISFSEEYYSSGRKAPVLLASEQLELEMNTLSANERLTYLELRVANAETPMEVEAAAPVILSLAAAGYIRPGDFGLRSDVPQHEIEPILEYALIMYGCQVFGGCGHKGLITLSTCQLTGICEPGWDMSFFLYNFLSPYVYSNASKVSDHLLSSRAAH